MRMYMYNVRIPDLNFSTSEMKHIMKPDYYFFVEKLLEHNIFLQFFEFNLIILIIDLKLT